MAKKADLSGFTLKANPSRQVATPAEAKPDAPKGGGAYKQKNVKLRVEALRELAFVKAETGKTDQQLAAEAFNLLFEKYGRAQLA